MIQKGADYTPAAAAAWVKSMLPARAPDGHKGCYGNALLYCGSPAYTGAACLAAMGAMRGGAGITHLAAPESVLLPVRIRLPEVVCHPIKPLTEAPGTLAGADRLAGARGCILIGCGLGMGDGSTAAAFCEALDTLLAQQGVPVVLDADALNLMACATPDPDALCTRLAAAVRPLVITPHPAEFARLAGTKVATVQADRSNMALTFAEKSHATVLLKGQGTVVADPDGSLLVNSSGTPALAKGGTGDVLAGLVTGLIAGGMSPFAAAFAGAYLHGRGGERLAARDSVYGLSPSELPAAIAREMQHLLAE